MYDSSICWSPSELPNANTGRRPMNWLMPTGLPASSSTSATLASLTSTGVPSRNSNLVTPVLPTTCSGGML
jgi:hypothetical protein